VRGIIWCAVVCVFVAGCAPDPPDSDASPTLSTPPPVTRPLDPSAYATEDTVCGLLTDEQIDTFDLPRNAKPHKRTETVFDCAREKEGGERWQLDYTLWLNVDLVGEWYDAQETLELLYIEGQPAAVNDLSDGRFCIVAVTLAEQKSVQVMGRGSRQEDAACSHVISVAEQMVRNIKG